MATLTMLAVGIGVTLSTAFVSTAFGVSVAFADELAETALRVDACPEQAPLAEGQSQEDYELERTKRAGDSYDKGLVLYDEGDYRAAVDAFVDSYCSKAHPSAFYNIAQSYERLLDFELSIRYFERYVAESDPSAATTKKAALRADVLRKLPAQIRVATSPEGASVIIRNSAGVTARGIANAKEPIEVTQGRYTMLIEKPGYESVEREINTEPGQPYSEYVNLQPNLAELEITATPARGRIFLGDRLVGVGSYEGNVPVGSYEITVEAEGSKTQKQVVQLTADQRLIESIVLEREATSGRRTLLVGTMLGLGLGSGVAISRVFQQDNSITFVGALATTGFGFGGAYYGIPKDTSMGDAWYILGSSVVGLFEGSIVGSFFGCSHEDVRGVLGETCNDSAITGAALSGGIAGIIGAALTYQRFKLTTGDVALLGSGAFWGIGSGAVLFAIFDSDVRVRDPMLFAGLNLGLISATGLVANSNVSLRRIAIIDLAGVGGVLAGVSLGKAFDSGDEELRQITLLGGVTGLVASAFLTRYLDDNADDKDASEKLLPHIGSAEDLAGHPVLSLGLSSGF